MRDSFCNDSIQAFQQVVVTVQNVVESGVYQIRRAGFTLTHLGFSDIVAKADVQDSVGSGFFKVFTLEGSELSEKSLSGFFEVKISLIHAVIIRQVREIQVKSGITRNIQDSLHCRAKYHQIVFGNLLDRV